MIRLLQILFFLLLVFVVHAQTPYLYFNRISAENGLSHNKVNCVIQDKRGFIWLGTDDGLNRYDGQYFTVFRHVPGDTSTLCGNIITDLLEDEAGIIWIATQDGGLSKYDYRLPAKKQFKQYKHIEGDTSTLPTNIINALIEDKYGYLWLGTSGFSALRFNKKTAAFEMPVKEGTKTVLDMCFDANGILWAGREGGGLVKINPQTLSYSMDERYKNLYANLPHAAVTAIYRDTEKNMWFGSWDNVLYRFNHAAQKEEIFKQNTSPASFPNDDIFSFAEDNTGRIWMGGRYFGLTIFDKAQQKFFNYQYNPSLEGSIADNRINCIYKDRMGFMWLGTNKGVSLYNPSQQPFIQTFLSKKDKDITVYDFLKDEKDRLWIGTSEGIFVREENSNDFLFKKLVFNGEQLAVTKFMRDEDGTWYLGTHYSLFVYNPETNKISLLPNTEKDSVMKKIIDSRVVCITRDTIDGHPVLLVSPYGHYLAYYDFTEKHWVSRIDTAKKILTRFNLRDNLIRKIFKTHRGNIWLATGKFGLGDWQKKPHPYVNFFLNNPSAPSSISNNNVYDIAEDKQNNLWVSTYGGGLNYFNTITKTFTHISATSNLTEGIQIDNNGNVWMISNGNLYKYDPHLKTNIAFNLPDLEKSGGVRGNIYKDKDGDMYAAGTNYFIQFNPQLVHEIKMQPKVHFTNFKIFNDSYSELLSQKSIELRYFQNYFTIEFAAPDFTGNDIQYSYKLEGIDNNWIDAGIRNFANYSNLPGGHYIFKVRASNKKGIWGAEVASLPVTIIPPFWKRWWFYALCAVIISSAVYALYRYSINEFLKRQAIRNRIAQDLHDNLGSTLSSISVYSQVAKIYQQQHKGQELQQTLEKIADTSGDMISEMSDIVWAINPKNDNMNTIIQRMESFAKPLLQTKNIAFSFEYDPSILQMHLQMEKRKNFYLIFKESINNALKYSGCKKLDVIITHSNHTIELIVKDDGAGFDINKINLAASNSLSGNGLKNMKMRAAEMNAGYKLESACGKGTTIRLTFTIP